MKNSIRQQALHRSYLVTGTSRSLMFIRLLEEKGASVSYLDPHVPIFTEKGHTMTSTPLSPPPTAS